MKSRVLMAVGRDRGGVGGDAGAAGAAGGPKPTKVSCTLKLVVAIPAGRLAPSLGAANGNQFGLVGCGRPFGRGVQSDSFQTSSSSAGAKVSGPYTEYFAAGTIRGRFNLPFKSSGGTSLTFNGTYSVVGGTGAYKGARASGKLSCSSPDLGVHVNCAGKLMFSNM
jgi:hypothetical protein